MKHSVILAVPNDEKTLLYEKNAIFCTGISDHRLGVNLEIYDKDMGKGEYVKQGEPLKATHSIEISEVKGLKDQIIRMIACGSSFTMALTMKGSIFVWGEGASGALGTGSEEDIGVPTEIQLGFERPPAKFIACGASHAGAITTEGELYMWGVGQFGQLGIEPLQNTNFPMKSKMPYKCIYLSLGTYHSAAITLDNSLYIWGGNKNGQLGLGDFSKRDTPESHKEFKDKPVLQVACGVTHTLVLSYANKLFAFGSNQNGKCGYGGPDLDKNLEFPVDIIIPFNDDNDKIIQIACSFNLSMALSKEGFLFTWGKGQPEILGREAMDDSDDEQSVNSASSKFGLDNNEIVTKKFSGIYPVDDQGGFKKDDTKQLNELSTTPIDIACGLFHSVVLTNGGEVYVWGSNTCGQHGELSEVLIRDYESAKRKVDPAKHLGLPIQTHPTLISTFDIRSNRRVTLIASGAEHILAVENGRKVFSWGKNTEGQLGLGKVCQFVEKPTAIAQLTDFDIKQIAASESHTLVLTATGEIYAFGSPTNGRLGLGISSSLQITPKKILGISNVQQIACGPNHSMALSHELMEREGENEGESQIQKCIYSWGGGWAGKLGHGNFDNVYVPTKIDSQIPFSMIACGTNHSSALTEKKGEFYGWGSKEAFCNYDFIRSALDDEKEELDRFYTIPTPLKLFEDENTFDYVALGNRINMVVSKSSHIYKWGIFEIQYEEEYKKKEDERKKKKNDKNYKLTEKDKELIRKDVIEKTPRQYETPAAVFTKVALGANHGLGLTSKAVFSWGFDGVTGRLGQNFEIFYQRENKKDKKKKSEKEEKAPPAKYIDILQEPAQIQFLSLIFTGNINLNRNEKGSKSEGAGAGGDNQSKMSKQSKKSAMSKRSRKTNKGGKGKPGEDDEADDQLAELLETNQIDAKESGMLVSIAKCEQDLFALFDRYSELSDKNVSIKEFTNKMDGELITKLSSSIFNISIVSKRYNHIPKEFLENKDIYVSLITIFQLHPCYLLNLYKCKDVSLTVVFNIIKEIYGDIQNDKRKTRLFILLCLQILEEELDTNVKDYKNLDFEILESDHPDTTPLFSNLLLHLVNSYPENNEFYKISFKTIQTIVTQVISTKPTTAAKGTALVFTGEGLTAMKKKYATESESSKKKIFGEKIKEITKVANEIIAEILKTKYPITNFFRKEVRFILIKTVERIQNKFAEAASQFEALQNKVTGIYLDKLGNN